jgi:hypothetical protein
MLCCFAAWCAQLHEGCAILGSDTALWSWRRTLWVIFFFSLGGALLGYAGEPRKQTTPCRESDKQFTIKHHPDRALTICPAGAPASCHEDFYLQAYEHREADLNQDGRSDQISIVHSGFVGINDDLYYYAAYLACKDGRYRQVMFDAFTTVEPASSPDINGYLPLAVTRSCYDASSGQYVTRQYSVVYDTQSGRYGPPDGDEALRDFCGDYERSLPQGLHAR